MSLKTKGRATKSLLNIFILVSIINPLIFFSYTAYFVQVADKNNLKTSRGKIITYRPETSGKSLIARGIELSDGKFYICRITSSNTSTACWKCDSNLHPCHYDLAKVEGFATLLWQGNGEERVVYEAIVNDKQVIDYMYSAEKYRAEIKRARLHNTISVLISFIATCVAGYLFKANRATRKAAQTNV